MKRPRPGCRLQLMLLAALLLVALRAEAQLVTLELSYSNPGARSTGFGGAFVPPVDLGVDLSDSRTTASVSAIYSF